MIKPGCDTAAMLHLFTTVSLRSSPKHKKYSVGIHMRSFVTIKVTLSDNFHFLLNLH